MKNFVFLLLTASIVPFFSSCRFYYKEKPQKGLLIPRNLSQISYQMVNAKVFAPRCISCHGNSGGVNLETYAAVKLNLAAIETSALITKTMPKNGLLSTGESDLLLAWIKAGAPENSQNTNPTSTPTPIPTISPTPTPTSIPVPEEPLKPFFNSIKMKIIDKRCIFCHSAGGNAPGVPLSTFKDLLKSPREIVLPNNSEESGLIIALERMDGKRMPPPESGNPLSNDEIATIRKWIDDGAPETETSGPSQPNTNSNPTPIPRPLAPTFVSIKERILDIKCNNCHSPGGKASDVPFINLKNILSSPREIVLPGNYEESGLFIAINRQDAKRMPPPENAAALKPEEIEVIKKWIEKGAPEN